MVSGVPSASYVLLKNLDNDPYPWQNPRHWADVNDDGDIAPVDVLTLINDINWNGTRSLATPASPGPPPFLDPSGDGGIAPDDGLRLINDINAHGVRPVPNDLPEGEGSGESVSGTEALAIWDVGEARFVEKPGPWFVEANSADATFSVARLRFESARLADDGVPPSMDAKLASAKEQGGARHLARRRERAARDDLQADALFARCEGVP